MPGFLMGILQFGWVGVNVCFSSLALAEVIPVPAKAIMVVWGALACFVGLKGIKYVARVATYLPLIPLITLIVLVGATIGSIGSFDPHNLTALQQKFIAENGLKAPAPALDSLSLFAVIVANVVGFFATAGAAGVDFGLNSRDKKDVSMGGLIGVALAIILIAGAALLVDRRGLRLERTASQGPGGGADGQGRTDLHPRCFQPYPRGPGTRGRQMGDVPAGHSGIPARLLLVFHRRQQFQDHPAQGESIYLRGHRHRGGHYTRVEWLRRRCRRQGVPDHRRLVRSDLWCHDGGLPAKR